MNIFARHPIILEPKNQIEVDFSSYWSDFVSDINQQCDFYLKSPNEAPVGCGAVELWNYQMAK